MKRTIWIFSALALASVVLALSPALKLRPGTIGNGAEANWIAAEGQHALRLAKNVPTSEVEAAGANIVGVEGKPVETLTALAWKLVSGPTGGGSPRWNLYYGQPGSGIEGYMFLEPSAYDGNGVGTITAAEIAANPNWVLRNIQPGDEIKYIQILVDEQEVVVLDDITLVLDGETTVFSGPGKSG
jgi:hypothetical protein